MWHSHVLLIMKLLVCMCIHVILTEECVGACLSLHWITALDQLIVFSNIHICVVMLWVPMYFKVNLVVCGIFAERNNKNPEN